MRGLGLVLLAGLLAVCGFVVATRNHGSADNFGPAPTALRLRQAPALSGSDAGDNSAETHLLRSAHGWDSASRDHASAQMTNGGIRANPVGASSNQIPAAIRTSDSSTRSDPVRIN